MSSLFELTADFQKLLEMAEDPDVDKEVLNDTLEALEGDIEAKADGYAAVIDELKGQVETLKKEKERIDARKTSLENRIEHLRENLKMSMILLGKDKIKTTLHSFSVKDSTPKLIIDDETAIPDGYLIPQKPKIDNDGIKKALKEGADFKFAHLEQGTSLTIR